MEFQVEMAGEAMERGEVDKFLKIVDDDCCEKHRPVEFFMQERPGPVLYRCSLQCQLQTHNVAVHCCLPYCIIPVLVSRYPHMPQMFLKMLRERQGVRF